MTASDDLFELISSLTQTEKRYFKRFAKIQTEKKANFVILFEAVEKQKRYDEKKLKEIFGSTFFAQHKKHLSKKILESLRAYHAGESVIAEINALTRDFEILFGKALYKQGEKALRKAKVLATTHEQFTELIRINKLEIKLLRAENNLEKLNEHTREYRQKARKLGKRIENQVLFEREYVRIIKWNNEIEFVRSKKEAKALMEIMDNSLLRDEKRALSLYAKSLFYYIKGLYHFFLGEFNTSESCFENQLILLEKNRNPNEDDLLSYIKAIANFTLLNLKLGRDKKFRAGMGKLEQLKGLPASTEQYVYYYKYVLELMWLTDAGNFSRAVKHIEKHSEKIVPLEVFFTEKNVLFTERIYSVFRTVLAYMGIGEHRKALRCLNNYLNEANDGLKKDIYCLARIINLFIHFEIGNTDLLESELVSTYRYLKSRGRLYEFEQVVMAFIKDVLNIGIASEKKMAFIELRKNLLSVKSRKYEKNVFDFFDFSLWAESKITGKTMEGILISAKKIA